MDQTTPNALPWLLTWIIFLPTLGALFLGLMHYLAPDSKEGPRWVALGFTLLTMGLAFVLAVKYNPALSAQSPASLGKMFQFSDYAAWIPELGISYHVGIDGLSLPMVLLTTVLMFVAVLTSSSWLITDRPKLYYFVLLLLETGVLGVFCSLDLFLFFVMWELELIPMYFLIGIWGGQNREYAAMKFILYTLFGSALMFVGFLFIYFAGPAHTFDIVVLLQNPPLARIDHTYQVLTWLALFIPFAIKLPMVPFHTWLPDAHVQAPTAISVLLAGILLKMGAYGMMRLNLGLLPDVSRDMAFIVGAFGVINIVYGAFLCLAQTDIKRIIAYSSISHMGFVLLGLSAMNQMGLDGAVLQMFTHGTITALLFLLVGIVYDHAHTRDVREMGGLAQRMPAAAFYWSLAALAAVGLPGTSAFVSEFMTFLGSYVTFPALAILGTLGVVLSAGYMLWLIQRMLFGPLVPAFEHVTDANGREIFCLWVLFFFVFAIGIYPAAIMDTIDPAVKTMLTILKV